MPRLALTALALYFALAFGWRSWVQWRRTGSTGFRGISGSVGSAEWTGGLLFVVALVAAPLAASADLLQWLPRLAALDHDWIRGLGMVMALLGTSGTLWSQMAMGTSWRIGVDDDERTQLVAGGPFRWVRNPIFTSMACGLTGIALLTPNVLAFTACVALILALQLQVRWVEEPYLTRAHGEAYLAYARRTGRFLPFVGLWRNNP